MQIKVEYRNNQIKILENSSNILANGRLPTIFVHYLELIDKIEVETVSFKYLHEDIFYSVKIEKNYTEYYFKFKRINTEGLGKDTDQIFQEATERYGIAELPELDNQISYKERMLLSMFFDLREIKKELTERDNWQDDLENKMNKWQDNFENKMLKWQDTFEHKLDACYLEKEDLSILKLFSQASKIELAIALAVILGFVIIVDNVDIDGFFDRLSDDPTPLIN